MSAPETLQQELDELRANVARRAEFVAILAHDVRTPLASIIGSAHTLRQRAGELTPDQREQLLGVIDREAERLASLLEEAFDTARIETGTFSYRFASLDLGALVEEAVAAANASGGAVSLVVEPGLPTVGGDRGRLRQVLSNLIENAVKFSPPGASVEVTARTEGGGVAVAVRDRGPGIAPEHREHIFEQFGRVEGTGKPGSGLGLYISRAIAEAHGGTLAVASAPGGGAAFTLTLPAA